MKTEINALHSNVITVELTDEKVTEQHIQQLEKVVEELHEKTDRVCLLILLGSHTKATIKMFFEAFGFIKKEHKMIYKIAIVADSKLVKTGVALDNLVLPWKEKYFPIENLEEAWSWITSS